jgi:hypothetical protein
MQGMLTMGLWPTLTGDVVTVCKVEFHLNPKLGCGANRFIVMGFCG